MWIYCCPGNDYLGHESTGHVMIDGHWKCNTLIVYSSEDFMDVSDVMEDTSSVKLVIEDDIRALSRGLRRQDTIKCLIILSNNSMDTAKQQRELEAMMALLKGIGFWGSISNNIG